MENWHWSPFVLFEAVGKNPELADMDNPKGHIYADVWYPAATNNYGTRLVSGSCSCDLTEILITCAFRNQEGVLPDENDYVCWPVYGSQAYIDGQSEDVARERAFDLSH